MPKRELEADEVYVVHVVEDGLDPPGHHTMQICREWGTAMSVVDGFMAAECSEEWTPHIIHESVRDTLKARWTWGDSEIRITVENVV